MQPPHDPIRFGERDRRELHVEPQRGSKGTEFHFKAFRFEPRKKVQVVIKGPGNYHVRSVEITTDDDGSINYFGLSCTAKDDWPLGEYFFSVDGIRTKFFLNS